MVTDPRQATTFERPADGDFRARLATFDGDTGFDNRDSSAGSAPGLVSVGFLRSALRRQVRLWGGLAIVGLIIGAGYAVSHPPQYTASTTVVVIDKSQSDPTSAITTDIALAQSTPVAAAVVSQLGLHQTAASFLRTYSVQQVTTAILSITASAPNSIAAVQRAAAIAAQYLAYRAKYEQVTQQQAQAVLQQQVTQAQQQLDSITTQLTRAQASGDAAEIKQLQAQQTTAQNNLGTVKENVTATLVAAQATTQQMISGSQVVSPATADGRSVKKTVVIYGLGGLLAGLAIGMAIVIIAAISSDRLRRRDDIAYAIDAPVRLSVGALRSGRLPHVRRRAVRRRKRDMERVVRHLRSAVPGRAGSAVPGRSKGASGLVVIAVDDVPTVARAVVALAVAESKQQLRIVLADLSAGTLAARQLGVKDPGVTTVTREGVPIVVAVPPRGEIAPIGPLRAVTASSDQAQVSEQFDDAFSAADLVLSLVTLDPTVGGDYLATWAARAVAVVTAGRSTATRIRAVGEMVRLAGAHLDSVVVVDADRGDESLGALARRY
jgi:capsular polysaccharide biosynthesis protein